MILDIGYTKVILFASYQNEKSLNFFIAGLMSLVKVHPEFLLNEQYV